MYEDLKNKIQENKESYGRNWYMKLSVPERLLYKDMLIESGLYDAKFYAKKRAENHVGYLKKTGKKFTYDTEFEDYFWSIVAIKENKDDCWLWTKNHGNGTYFIINHKKKSWYVHRLSYFLHYKVDPGKLSVLHKCDTPRCVNPHHLFLGTQKDNIDDMVAKNRCSRKPVRRTLSDEAILDIRYDKSGLTTQGYADKYAVSDVCVRSVKNNESWKNITL